jgi:hypothetical protein
MRMSTDRGEEAYAGLLALAGGDSKLVVRALQPAADGTPVSFEEAAKRVVELRLAADQEQLQRANQLTTVMPLI